MTVRIMLGDVRLRLSELPDESVHCVVTSPPYFGLRDYGVAGQIGLEDTPAAFVAVMVEVFREVRRVLRSDGVLWLNLGDSYANDTKWGGTTSGKHVTALHGDAGIGRRRQNTGLKSKDLIGIPWRVAFALQADGWYLRQDIIWSKPNPMPESVTDRCTKAHEYLFLLTKSARYYFDAEAIAEPASPNTHARLAQNVAAQRGSDRVPGKTNGPMKAVARGSWKGSSFDGARDLAVRPDTGRKRAPNGSGIKSNESFYSATAGHVENRNKRSVWTVATQPFSEAHFATFPPALIEPCILAGCPKGGTVLDPFGGAGTTGLVADRHGRDAVLIELNPEYAAIAERRIKGDSPLFAEVAA
jgi:DNA modification methylase